MASSLAQTLVPDLLSIIFLECTPSILSPPVLSIAPLNISLVCRSWRALALERSDLWATIRLSFAELSRWFDAYPNRRLPLYILLYRIWRFWLARSRDAPLDIQLELFNDPDSDKHVLKKIRQIFRELLKNQHRWRSVTIENMNMVVDDSDGYVSSNLSFSPLLEKLSGRFHYTSYRLRNLVTGFDISGCHRLECFALRSLTKVVPITCQMHQLRILKVMSINMDGLIAILQCSPNLEVLTITFETYGPIPDPEHSRLIPLPVLTDIDVRSLAVESNWREWASLLGCLQCPSLVNFRFLFPSSDDVLFPLTGFFIRSRPPLKWFSIETMFDEPENEHVLLRTTPAFHDILKTLPHLIFLDVKGLLVSRPEFGDAFAMNNPNGDGLCPLLTHRISFYTTPSYQSVTLNDGREMRHPGDVD